MSDATSLTSSRRLVGLSAFSLKLIAAIAMLCDHVGAYLFPQVTVLRVIGRLAFPIFAYFIAEGCRYTRNKTKRFLMVLGLALVCEIAYVLTSGEITGTVLVTFSCSIPMVYALQAVKASLAAEKLSCGRISLCMALFVLSIGATVLVGYLVPMDYGIPGALLPVFLSFLDYVPGKTPAFFQKIDRHAIRLAVFALGLVLIWRIRLRVSGEIQVYALLSVLPMAFYNGTPGPRTFKYWFYVFFPAHLLLIWMVSMLLGN